MNDVLWIPGIWVAALMFLLLLVVLFIRKPISLISDDEWDKFIESEKVKPRSAEHQYHDILEELVETAEQEGITPDRTGTGRVRIFGRTIRVNLSDGSVPVITSRKINTNHGVEELLWMIKGSSNINELPDTTKPIWKGWAINESHVDAFIAKFMPDADPKGLEILKKNMLDKLAGSIGPMYGHFWRNNPSVDETSFLPLDSLELEDIPSDKFELYGKMFDEMLFINNNSPEQERVGSEEAAKLRTQFIKTEYFNSNDQLGEVIRGIKRRPYSARHLISSWIPQYAPFESVLSPHENVLIGRGALTACHAVPIQFLVRKAKDGGPDYLTLIMYQRSCDFIIGVPTNLTFYGTMLHLVAHCTGLRVEELVWHGGDVHLYSNTIEAANTMLERIPFQSPKIKINEEARDIFAMKREDIQIVDYQHHDPIKVQVSV